MFFEADTQRPESSSPDGNPPSLADQIRFSKSEIAMLRALAKGTPQARVDWLKIQQAETNALLIKIAAEISELEKQISAV